jgi:hypothetical protein
MKDYFWSASRSGRRTKPKRCGASFAVMRSIAILTILPAQGQLA